jgi:GntR family transcriptional repressor for pyruvate dehydrogenase complex
MIEHGLKILKATSESEKDFDKDEVVGQIKGLIEKHQLEEGDRLPSERKLSEKLNVSRNQIRAAIQKLEFYGVIKTMPQSGSVITGIDFPSINNMLSEILDIETGSFKSLVETRLILEVSAIQIAATRRSQASLNQVEQAHVDFIDRIVNNEPSLIEDLKFHLALVKASENPVLHGLMKILVPDIIGHFNKEHICDRTQGEKLIKEHEAIVIGLRNSDVEQTVTALESHFTALREYMKK